MSEHHHNHHHHDDNVYEITPLMRSNNSNRSTTTDDTTTTTTDNNDDSFYYDPIEHQTWGRRISSILSRYSWYKPKNNTTTTSSQTKPPSLEKAWMYFEHQTLVRHFVTKNDDSDSDPSQKNKPPLRRRRAEAGENHHLTRLYPILSTTEDELSDFGLGVGQYFFALRGFALIFFVAGCFNVPLLLYYAGGSYNGDLSSAFDGVRASGLLRASAICVNVSWEPCPSCDDGQWLREAFPPTRDRYATTTVATADGTLEELRFILVNHCEMNPTWGYYTLAGLLAIIAAIAILRIVAQRKDVEFDEGVQTSSDYSIQIRNPPGDARDASEWKTFFSRFGRVTCVTVTLNNEAFLRALVRRRELKRRMKDLQPPGDYDEELFRNMTEDKWDEAVRRAHPVSRLEKIVAGAMDAGTIRREIRSLEEEIRAGARREYEVSNVFVTFEAEAEQSEALRRLSVSGMDVYRNNLHSLDDAASLAFRGTLVLDVVEPMEPSSIRWMTLTNKEGPMGRLKRRGLSWMLSFLFMICGCVMVVGMLHIYGPVYAAITVTVVNCTIPYYFGWLVDAKETHPNEGSRQTSLFLKISIAMFVNTTFITAYITPSADTLTNNPSSLLPAIYAIFVAELLKYPLTSLLDPFGHINRHILAPRALDQRRMNAYFRGSPYELSERYTNMTNILFLTFWYASLFPAAFFLAAGIMTVHYWSDKFCLLRTWSRRPLVGSQMAKFSRNYLYAVGCIVLGVMTSYNFAAFPMDNACLVEGGEESVVPREYVGTFETLVDLEGKEVAMEESMVIEEGRGVYKYCNQDMMRYSPPAFPAIPSKQPLGGEWMTPRQERLCWLLGWTSVVIVIGGLMLICRRFIVHRLQPLFAKVSQTMMGSSDDEQQQSSSSPPKPKFSDVLDIHGYIPQVHVDGFLYPILLCDVSGIGDELLSWHDHYHSYDYHNAIYDVPSLVDDGGTALDGKRSIFSTVHHWPPPPTVTMCDEGEACGGESKNKVV